MEFPDITHHGGATGVTGSCHQLWVNASCSLLIDCGLFQGRDADSDKQTAFEKLKVSFPLNSVKALIVTHVHIDHIGRLPYLLAAGFNGPLICSPPSAILLPLVIEDALKIGFTRDESLIRTFLEKVRSQLLVLDYKQWHELFRTSDLSIRIRLQRAGHILGSALAEVDICYGESSGCAESKRVVFSGDLGAPWSPLLPAPRSPHRADILVMESTYGDRLHANRKDRSDQLRDKIEEAIAYQGHIIIPAFSIGRTQELLYELEHIIHRADPGSPLKHIEVIIDSPLAARFTEAYRELKPWWDKEARQRLNRGRHPLNFDSLYTVGDHDEHMQTVGYLKKSRRSAIVIAASGMVSGGRVVNYLKAMLGDTRHLILFVGYQAHGTPGADILRYGPTGGWVSLDGQRFSICARVSSISGYSAHADQKDLVNFVQRIPEWPSEVRLVHGYAGARLELKKKLEVICPDSEKCRIVLPIEAG